MTKFQTLSATMNHRASVSLVLVVKMMFANAAAAMPPQLYCHLLSLVVVGCAAVVQIWSKPTVRLRTDGSRPLLNY